MAITAGQYAGTTLDATQARWAQQIIDVCRTNPSVTDRDVVCALACVRQESNFWMYANDGKSTKLTGAQQQAIRASLNLPHDKVGHDSASVGLFQQQPFIPGRSWGWGSIAQCMDVAYSTRAFLGPLLRISNRPAKSVTSLVQTVQKSAFPDAYAKHEQLGWALLNAYKAAAILPAPAPVRPPTLSPWHLPDGHFYGNINGPEQSHGGDRNGDDFGFVRNIQQWLVYRNCVPGLPSSAWTVTGWVDGIWGEDTDRAMALWHDRFYPNQPAPTQCWSDDYALLAQ